MTDESGMLNDTYLQKYSEQLRGLSLQQAQFTLSTTALSSAQKEQVLIEAGLLASKDKIKASLVESALAQNIDNEAKQKVFNKGFIILDEKRNLVTVLRNEKDKFSIKDYIGLYTPGFTDKSLYADIDNVVMENKDLPAYNTLSELNSAINNIR